MKILHMVFCLLFIYSISSAQDINIGKQKINVIFNDSAVQYVLKNPVNALKEREFIWNNFDGYRITLVWHRESSYPVDWKYWEKCMDRFINKDTALTGKTIELANNLMALEKKEHDKIVSHLSAFFPDNISYDAYVYLVVSTVPYAFCVEQNKIGIDITGDEWYFDPEYVLNVVIHELFHAGYRTFTADKKYLNEDPSDRETFIRFCYAYTLNEGMASYVGYKALDLFPTNNRHRDYKLFENDSTVKIAIEHVNDLLYLSDTLPIDSLNKLAWDIGVGKRAYYVSGAYMAKTVEEKYGREHLAALIQKGGYEFVKEYNSIAPKELKIALL